MAGELVHPVVVDAWVGLKLPDLVAIAYAPVVAQKLHISGDFPAIGVHALSAAPL